MTLQATNQGLQTVFVYGASGHAKVLIDAIEKQGQFQVLGLLDDNPALKGVDVYGYKVIGGKEEISSQDCSLCLVAIGDNRIRHQVGCWLESVGVSLPDAIVHPSASLANGLLDIKSALVPADFDGIVLPLLDDLDGDGLDEIIVAFAEEDRLILRIFDDAEAGFVELY